MISFAYCHWRTPKRWKYRQQARPQHGVFSSSASLRSSPSVCHPLTRRTAAQPLCVEGTGDCKALPAAQGHRACPGMLPWGAAQRTCSFGSIQSYIRGGDQLGRLHTAEWTSCGISGRISRSAANMSPIPAHQLCAELTAHVLRVIQNLLKNRIYNSVISMYSTYSLEIAFPKHETGKY